LKVSYRVLVKGPDGKTYSVTMDWLKRELGIPSTKYIRERIGCLEETLVEDVLKPRCRWEILEFLKENKGIDTRDFNSWIYSGSILLQRAMNRAKEELEAEGLIVSKSQGSRGKPRKWYVKEEASEDE